MKMLESGSHISYRGIDAYVHEIHSNNTVEIVWSGGSDFLSFQDFSDLMTENLIEIL